jgi:hypothetical protein
LAYCSSLKKNSFKIQNGWKIQYGRFFGNGTAGWNVLIFGYVIVLAMMYCKKLVASPEKS